MSGNPFRRQRLLDETTYSDGPNANPQATVKAKKKKRVVIQTPPHSPEEPSIPRRSSDGRTGSPPHPPPPSLLEEDETDSTTTADSDLEQALVNTRRNSGSLPAPSTGFGVQTGSRAPYNPFARTLVTSEAAFGLQKEQGKAADGGAATADGAAQSRQNAGRPALDVDAFKNILMTGSAAPSPPTASTAQRPQDNSSSTDTSSLSRHSIFDPTHDAHPESPRTSFDDHPESEGEDGDDEHSSLMGPVSSRPVEEGPPAPPKQQHGRAFPQTVSFAEFDESIPSAPAPPRLEIPLESLPLRPSTPRSSSDLNKPLPPPPAEKMNVNNTVNLEPPQKLGPASNQPSAQLDIHPQPSIQTDVQPQAKKAAPPPPVSRRRGEAGQGRPRSESNLSQSSSQPSELRPSSSADQAAKPPPPPPPSRRAHPTANSPSPAIEIPPSPASQTTAQTEVKVMPPPPPRRNPSKHSTSINRTPSNASRSSLPRSDSFTAAAAPTAPGHAPPAPPPRRGAASKRNSTDGPPNSLATRHSSTDYRRTSRQSFESDRSMSANWLQKVAEPGEIGETESAVSSAATERPPTDVLADLDAFQAEIEALRKRAEGRS